MSWTAKSWKRRRAPAPRRLELERAAARERSNTERVSELEARIAASGAELEQTRTQLAGLEEERAQHKRF